jgi:hypothetical protein
MSLKAWATSSRFLLNFSGLFEFDGIVNCILHYMRTLIGFAFCAEFVEFSRDFGSCSVIRKLLFCELFTLSKASKDLRCGPLRLLKLLD